tara:strand:- start:613 stop:2538 length:1926 start_codon:yes stop_codon:yes gene_type:complete
MATLLGDATLTTTTSISDFDTVVGTNNANKQQTTDFRKPRAVLRVDSGAVRSGAFLPLTDRDTARLIGYVDPSYSQEDTFLAIDNLSYNTAGASTDRFVFDFNEIQEVITTNIDRVQIKLTVTTGTLTGVGSSTIQVSKDNFAPTGTSADTYGGTKTLNSNATQTFTFDTDDDPTPSVTFIGTGPDGHGGSFLPFQYAFSTSHTGTIRIDSVEVKLTYTGKTLLPGPYIKNDSITYVQKDSGGSVVSPIDTIIKTGGSDELSFNWDAGSFSTPQDTVATGLGISEYIVLARDSGPGTDFFFTEVENAQYTITQDGSDKGAVLPNTERQWQPDRGDSSGAVVSFDTNNAIARSNLLTDQSISNIDRSDITTSFNMKVPYASADTSQPPNPDPGDNALSQTSFKLNPLSNSLQAYMRFLFAPSVLGAGALDSVFGTTFGTLNLTHRLAASDIDTQASSFTQDGQGGFLLEGAASISGAMSFGINAGFQLSVIESQSTSATLVAEGQLAILAGSTPTSSFTLTEDVTLFVQTELSVSSSFTHTAGPTGLGVIHGMTQTDIGILPSSVTAISVATSLPGPDAARTFVLLGAETRTVPVNTETRTVETVSQTLRDGLARIIVHNTETRTLPVEQQTRILDIKGYSG